MEVGWDGETDRQIDRDTDRDRDTERQRETETDRQTGRERERERERERDRDRDRETDRQTDRQTDTDTERQRERERQTDRQTYTDRQAERGSHKANRRPYDAPTLNGFRLKSAVTFNFKSGHQTPTNPLEHLLCHHTKMLGRRFDSGPLASTPGSCVKGSFYPSKSMSLLFRRLMESQSTDSVNEVVEEHYSKIHTRAATAGLAEWVETISRVSLL